MTASHHDHGPHGHDHSHASGKSEKRVAFAALLTGLFMIVEVAGGVASGSLALIADAGHMLTDTAGLMLAWLGFRLARRPADRKRSFGYGRFGVLAAFTNGLALFAIGIWIVVEAAQRLADPGPILGGIMLWVAMAGLAVNIAAFWILSGGHGDNLNIRAAVLHVVGDLLGSVAAIAAAVVILLTGWTPIDPLLSALVAVLILGAAWRIVRDSGHILLEGTPQHLDAHEIASDLAQSVPDVVAVHHVHAWSMSQERMLVTLHARVRDTGGASEAVVAAIKSRLRDRFGIDHATVEIERADGPLPPEQHCAPLSLIDR